MLSLEPELYAKVVKSETINNFKGRDYFELSHENTRKRTRNVYFTLTERRWQDRRNDTRTLTINKKISQHFRYVINCKLYKTAKDLRDAFFQLFAHIIGDHELCTATCPHLEVEAWQKN